MEKPSKTFRLINYFGTDTMPDPSALKNMAKELEQFSEPLYFELQRNEDGWAVQCKQIPGIIAGGQNINPADTEVINAIREAIRAVFNITVTARPRTKNIDCFQVDIPCPPKNNLAHA